MQQTQFKSQFYRRPNKLIFASQLQLQARPHRKKTDVLLYTSFPSKMKVVQGRRSLVHPWGEHLGTHFLSLK